MEGTGMTEESKTTKAIAILLEQTQEGLLKWKVSGPAEDLSQGTDIDVDLMYVTEKEGRTLRLYPYRCRSYTDEDVWHWEDRVALELSDPEKMSWWEFPKDRVIWDLLEAVKFKTVGVDTFIDKLLKEKDPPF
jgi:hypothetical protein